MADITALDYILLPFYLIIIYKIAFYYRDKYYPLNHPFRNYFIPGLTVKIAGSLFIAFIYGYYYGDGDTFNFFTHAQIINNTLIDSPDTWWRLITHRADINNPEDMVIVQDLWWYDDISSYTTSCLGAIIGLFCFTKYIEINVITASIVFIGMWLMFVRFASQYSNTKLIALAILFMPGPAVWGSGLFKDSFCIFSVGCLVYSFYILFERKKLKAGLLILSVISIIIIILVKAYILVALVPVLIFKVLLEYRKRIRGNFIKKLVFYTVLLIAGFGIYKGMAVSVDALSKYNTENVLNVVKTQKDYLLSTNTNEGSFYNLGDFEPTIQGVSKLILPAINVTLFRPYPWEAKSVIQYLNMAESSATLLLTLYVIFTINPLVILKYIYQDSNLIMCLIFTMIFAFFVGISSYNFGALSRYKIPVTPFYITFIAILISKSNEEKIIKKQV